MSTGDREGSCRTSKWLLVANPRSWRESKNSASRLFVQLEEDYDSSWLSTVQERLTPLGSEIKMITEFMEIRFSYIANLTERC